MQITAFSKHQPVRHNCICQLTNRGVASTYVLAVNARTLHPANVERTPNCFILKSTGKIAYITVSFIVLLTHFYFYYFTQRIVRDSLIVK